MQTPLKNIRAIPRLCLIILLGVVFNPFCEADSWADTRVPVPSSKDADASALPFGVERAYSNFIPSTRFLNSNSEIPKDCNLSILSFSPNTHQTHILTSVTYNFEVSLHPSCHLQTTTTHSDAMTCTQPIIRTEPASTRQALINKLEVSCQFSRPGVFYTSPIDLRAFHKDGRLAKRAYPGNIKIQVAQFDDKFDSTIPVEKRVVFMPWQISHFRVILFSSLVIVLVFGAIFIAWLFWHSKDKTRIIAQHEPSPIEAFHAELAPLIDIRPATSNENKQLYDGLSCAMRRLIKRLFHIDALNMTTHHTVRALKKLSLDEGLCNDVKRILSDADRVKFTLELPSHTTTLILMRDMTSCGIKLDEIAQKRIQEEKARQKENFSQTKRRDSNSKAEASPVNTADAKRDKSAAPNKPLQDKETLTPETRENADGSS